MSGWRPQEVSGHHRWAMACSWVLLLPLLCLSPPLMRVPPSAIATPTGTLQRKGEARADFSEVQLGWFSLMAGTEQEKQKGLPHSLGTRVGCLGSRGACAAHQAGALPRAPTLPPQLHPLAPP